MPPKSKPDNEYRSYPLRFNVSQLERELIQEKYDRSGFKTLSDFVRACVLRRHIPKGMPEVNQKVYVQLGRIGNDLYQVVQILSGSGQPLDESLSQQTLCQLMEQTIPELRSVIETLRDALLTSKDVSRKPEDETGS